MEVSCQQMEGETVDGTARGASRDLQDEGHLLAVTCVLA